LQKLNIPNVQGIRRRKNFRGLRMEARVSSEFGENSSAEKIDRRALKSRALGTVSVRSDRPGDHQRAAILPKKAA
jgi:hypothetical protein